MTDKPHMTLPNGDKLFEGDYGCTRDGRKVGPAVYDYNDEVGLPWALPIGGGDTWYTAEGESNGGVLGDIIAKWTEAPAQPETGTLAELNVKPGDVVQALHGDGHLWPGTKQTVTADGWVVDGDGDYWGPGAEYSDYPRFAKFRIVSRASDAPNPEGPARGGVMAAEMILTYPIWTEAPKEWRDMTPEEKGALLLAHHEGKAIETLDGDTGMWREVRPGWVHYKPYRIKPEPKRETVAIGYRDDQGNWHEIGKIDLSDGKPDPATIRMEELK